MQHTIEKRWACTYYMVLRHNDLGTFRCQWPKTACGDIAAVRQLVVNDSGKFERRTLIYGAAAAALYGRGHQYNGNNQAPTVGA
jgi:hypothetical protein